MLAALAARLAPRSRAEGDRIDTVGALLALARRAPGELDAGARADLHALARKIHVARRVASSYAPGWKRREGAEPLDAAGWPLLVAVLLASAEPAGPDELARGLALKCLNAALAALELAPPTAPGLPELRARAEALLARVQV